jgi:predicted transcriptional regulator
MLTELLRLLEQNQAEYNLQELGRILGVQPSAVAGMLETLVRKGRVLEVGADCSICDSCGIRGHCDIPVTRAKRYKISTN